MLKTQCYFKLADYVNTWKIRISVQDKELKNKLIEELDIIVEIWLDQDGKTRIIKKEDIIAKLWRSPDIADMIMMRMFFELDKKESMDTPEKQIDPLEDPLWIFAEDDKEEVEISFNPYD